MYSNRRLYMKMDQSEANAKVPELCILSEWPGCKKKSEEKKSLFSLDM